MKIYFNAEIVKMGILYIIYDINVLNNYYL